MSTTTPSTYWFKRRRYGIGWTPATPQGWLDVDVWPYAGCTARYKVFDARNQQVINSGSTTGVSKRLYGVHSWYHITMTLPGWRCGGEASLDNEPG